MKFELANVNCTNWVSQARISGTHLEIAPKKGPSEFRLHLVLIEELAKDEATSFRLKDRRGQVRSGSVMVMSASIPLPRRLRFKIQ